MSPNHWTKYWQSGVQTSLPGDFINNYDGEIYAFWKQRVDELTSGDHVLDICTGNGAVALIIAEIALQQNKKLNITAIDISEINTVYINQNNDRNVCSQIQFFSHCSVAEVNQYITEKQQLVVSQYGLEYTDLNITADVIFNITKSNGELAFIAHSADSDVFDYMQTEQSIYQWFSDIGIMSVIDSFIKNQCSANGLKNKLLTIIQNNQPPVKFHGQSLLFSWQKTLTMIIKSNNQVLKTQRKQLKDYLDEHTAAWLRADDMVAVGRKLANKNWTEEITRAGFTCLDKQAIVYKGKHLAGHSYRFKK